MGIKCTPNDHKEEKPPEGLHGRGEWAELEKATNWIWLLLIGWDKPRYKLIFIMQVGRIYPFQLNHRILKRFVIYKKREAYHSFSCSFLGLASTVKNAQRLDVHSVRV